MSADDPGAYPIDEIHFAQEPDVGRVPGPNSRTLVERQRRVESSAVKYADDVPIALAEGRGATVRDVDGNTFLDFFAGIGVLNVGHANPYVTSAATRQAESLVQSLDFPTETRLELVEALDRIAPGELSGNSRVFFGGPTGSNAIEASIKLAKHNTDGHGLVAFRGSFHGTTSGALSLTARTSSKEDYTPLLPDVVHVPHPSDFADDSDPDEARERSLEEVEAVLGGAAGGLANPAGVWIEPIQAEGGVTVPPDGFLEGLAEITDAHGVPLVFDEIQTGFGRTGEWFAAEAEGVTPDVLTMGKAIGGVGLPLSAVVYDERLDTWGAGAHTGTFRGHLPAMRAGLHAIEYVEAHDLLAHARDLGRYVRDRLREAADGSPLLADVRGRGLLIGAEFRDAGMASAGEVVRSIQTRCYERGVLVWTAGPRGDVLRLLPPLVMTRQQASSGLDVVVDAIADVTADLTPAR